MEDKGLTVDAVATAIEEKIKGKGEVEPGENVIFVYPANDTLAELQRLSEKIREVRVKGINDVTHVVIRKEPDGYILYTEGAFDRYEPVKQSDLEPFMKCESGKCAPGKCGGFSKE